MPVICKIYEDPEAFRDVCLDYLMRSEAAYCLALGAIDSLIHRPKMHARFHLAAFFDKGAPQVLGVAWMVGFQPLGVTALPERCLPALVRFAKNLKVKPSGIAAPASIAMGFKARWLELTGATVSTYFAQAIYELDHLVKPPAIRGAMRLVMERDKDLMVHWCWRFVVDCGMATGDDNGSGAIYADQAIAEEARFLWEVDGEPRCMAGVSGRTPNGIRIGWVYTPPEFRGRGYAAYLVARICEAEYAKGKTMSFLYTDLKNPTSNHVYQSLGFKEVARPLHFAFQYP